MRRYVTSLLFATVLACSASLAPVAPGDVVERSMSYSGTRYPFLVFVPTSYAPGAPSPAMLLVHGAGGNGAEFIRYWQALAESKGIILVAPTLDLSADAETRVPIVFPRIMNAVSAEWSVDASRRYLFGYSAGGYFVYDAALLNADYFAGAGVYASVIQPEYEAIVRQAPRKTSIAIYVGDRDPYFSLPQARRTRDLLRANDMDVHYVELPNHDHEYGSVSALVNADAWAFLSSRTAR